MRYVLTEFNELAVVVAISQHVKLKARTAFNRLRTGKVQSSGRRQVKGCRLALCVTCVVVVRCKHKEDSVCVWPTRRLRTACSVFDMHLPWRNIK